MFRNLQIEGWGECIIEMYKDTKRVLNYNLNRKTSKLDTQKITGRILIDTDYLFLRIEKCTCLLFMYPFCGRSYRHLCRDTDASGVIEVLFTSSFSPL